MRWQGLLFRVFLLLSVCTIGGCANMIREHRDTLYTLEVIRPFPGSITLPGDPKSWSVIKNEQDLITVENKMNGDTVGFSNGRIGHGYYSGYGIEKFDNIGIFKDAYYGTRFSLRRFIGEPETIIIEEQIDNIDDDFLMFEAIVKDKQHSYFAVWVHKPKVIKVFLTAKDERQIAIKNLIDMVESATGAKIKQQGPPEHSLFD